MEGYTNHAYVKHNANTNPDNSSAQNGNTPDNNSIMIPTENEEDFNTPISTNTIKAWDKGAVYTPIDPTAVAIRAARAPSDEEPSKLETSLRRRFSPMTLAWNSIDVYAKARTRRFPWTKNTLKESEEGLGDPNQNDGSQRKHILKGVSGVVKPGTLVAIMGASGAGKSTLMNVLAGRSGNSVEVSGEVTVNGCKIDELLGDISAYVQQEDALIPSLTVREQLNFRALLRMDKSYSKEEREARVKTVIRELSLTKCAETLIGDERIRGISGGEKKRVSFASEILTDPPLIFLDEPTSGLDSYLAKNLIQSLRNMASRGRTIITTIHQPSSEIFTMFDNLLLMVDGKTVYMGPTKDAMVHFKQCGLECPNNYNPADFYLDNLSIVPGYEHEYYSRIKVYIECYERSEHNASIDDYLKRTKTRSIKQFQESSPAAAQKRFQASLWTQFTNLLWRSWITAVRDPASLKFRSIQTLAIGLLLGLIYLQQDIDQLGVMNINGLLFILVTNTSFSSQFMVINIFPLEMAVILRDFKSKLYSVEMYYLCKSLADIPFQVIFPLLLNAIVYWMVGLNPDFTRFLESCAVLVLVSCIASSFGFFMSAMAGTVQNAMAIAPPLLAPLMLFGGLFMNSESIPDYFIWLKYLSWFSYATELVTVNQWEDIESIKCTNIANVTCQYNNGTDVLKFLNFHRENYLMDYSAMLALFIGFRFLGYFCLLLRSKNACCC
ncbi:protein white-like [Argonauta hians]